MKKIVVITNILTNYQIDFFNRLLEVGKDINLTVFADLKSNSLLNNYVNVHCKFNTVDSPMKDFHGIIFRKSIKKKIDTINPDFIVFYANPREASLSILMIYYWLIGRSFYVHGMFHRIGGQTLVSKSYYRLMGIISDKCLTYSRKGAQVLLGLGVKAEKIKVVGTAINEKKSIYYANQINSEQLNKFKKHNGLSDKKIVLQVVRLSKIKKPDMILDIAKNLSSYRSDIIFVLIGEGEMYDEIKSRIDFLNLKSVVFLLGSIYDEKVLSYWFRAAKVFVMPTCIGLSAHHAFSYSLPIVTDDDYLQQASEFDILCDGLNSIIYKSGNIKSFEKSILNIIDDEKLHHFLSKNALQTVKVSNSLDAKCKNYLSCF